MTIYAYQKISDAHTTYTITVQQGVRNQELCTINGVTYHFVDGVLEENQSPQIEVIDVDVDQQTKSLIKSSSPVMRLIDQRVKNMIRERYDLDEELYLARIAIGAQAGIYELEPGEGRSDIGF